MFKRAHTSQYQPSSAYLSAAFNGNIGAYALLNAKIQTATRKKHTQSESNAALSTTSTSKGTQSTAACTRRGYS
eukprot:3770686-Rhodomonas_salina.1